MLDDTTSTVPTVPSDETIFYYDRLGKLERFRRQIYAFTVTGDVSRRIFYGIVTSYEFINGCDEDYIPPSNEGSLYHRGINEVFIVTSRDGTSWDMES